VVEDASSTVGGVEVWANEVFVVLGVRLGARVVEEV
jgi:hypothetical protein